MAASTLTSITAIKDLSSASSARAFSGALPFAPILPCKARITCSNNPAAAEEETETKTTMKKMATALAIAAVVAASSPAQEAMADVAGLTPCKDSPAFAKRQGKAIKKLEKRLAKYAPDSAPALAINATIEKTNKRFAFYGSQGLLCGTDGLPHLIVDGDQAHLKEFVYPGILFLYIAGWIGWVGRSYLIEIKATEKKPAEKEIIIDVPLATRLSWRGFVWPLAAISEFRNGKLLEDASNITVSPR